MKEIEKVDDFRLQVLVTGMHLSPEFGLTYKEIEKDGFQIAEKITMLLSSDSDNGITKSIGLAIIGFADAFERLKPDFLILLGDRFETYAAAVAGHVFKIPIAHLYGGELTEGAIDDAFRHSITKFGMLHFTATKEYRKRVIQMGEEPQRVINVGAIGIDNIKNFDLLTKLRLEKDLGFRFWKKNLLVTFHPASMNADFTDYQFDQLLEALNYFKNYKIIFTKPNCDNNGRIIIKKIDEYVKKNLKRTVAFDSMGQLRYLSTIQYVDSVVGNSSSGIIEVPALKKPTVNIGNRQKGRVRCKSIIDCNEDKYSIIKAIEKSVSEDFKLHCQKVKNPYGDGGSVGKIIEVLKNRIYYVNSNIKSFFNIDIDRLFRGDTNGI